MCRKLHTVYETSWRCDDIRTSDVCSYAIPVVSDPKYDPCGTKQHGLDRPGCFRGVETRAGLLRDREQAGRGGILLER